MRTTFVLTASLLGVALLTSLGAESFDPGALAASAAGTANVRVVEVIELPGDFVIEGGPLRDTAEPREFPEVCSADPHEDPLTYRVRGRRLHQLEVTLADYGVFDWAYPIDEDRSMASTYGYRRGVFDKSIIDFHGGQDIGCVPGESIYAAADGLVTVSALSGEAGNFVRLEHGEHDGRVLATRYLHLSQRLVRTGDEVLAGQRIGRCGNTGSSTSAHLHFEVMLDEERVRPVRRPLPDVQACLD